jgi:uncharacterized membrane protein YhaH (DUF805 family)
MESFSILSPSGRTARAPFALGTVLVYALLFASHGLLLAPVTMRSGVAPFAIVQAALTFAWYVLHARRLHDAQRSTGSALAIAVLYGLGVVLFMLLAQFVSGIGPDWNAEPNKFAGILIIVFLIALISGDTSVLGLFFYVALIILIIIFTPLLIALGFSIWTGTHASAPGPATAP